MKSHYILITVLSVFLFSCSSTKLSVSKLASTWELGKVYESEVNVTNRENPNRDRFITFYPDGTFISGGAPYGDLNGTWQITEEQTLQISPAGEGEVGASEWVVTIEGNTMTWKGTVKSDLDRFELSWKKK